MILLFSLKTKFAFSDWISLLKHIDICILAYFSLLGKEIAVFFPKKERWAAWQLFENLI